MEKLQKEYFKKSKELLRLLREGSISDDRFCTLFENLEIEYKIAFR